MRKRWTELSGGATYLLVGLLTALASLVMLPLLVVLALLCVLGVGVFLLPTALAWLRRWVAWHHRRAGRLVGAPVVAAAPLPGTGPRQLVTAPATWRDIRWLAVHVAVGVPVGLLALFACGAAVGSVVAAPLWWLLPADAPLRLLGIAVTDWPSAVGLGLGQALAGLLVALLVVPGLARAHARSCLAVLTPSAAEQLARRVDTLTETRAKVMDAHGAELRRIERDLHDGTQARLVALSMRLGMAREALHEDPETMAVLLAEAHQSAEEAMVELRDVIRTMYPPILADRGLAGALWAMAARAAVPTQVDVGPLGTVPAAVEAAAYFAVAEGLTNVAKHSRATAASVRVSRAGAVLSVVVTDNGVGGADAARGTGLSGIARRAAALDGSLQVSSPAGGPTSVRVELPCGS